VQKSTRIRKIFKAFDFFDGVGKLGACRK
jgi:hypothetical protein